MRGLAATVYTQLADVEEEVNGLVTYDRRFVKVPVETMRAINDRLRAAAGDARAGARATASVPASSKEPA